MSHEVFLPQNFKCNHESGCDPVCRLSHPRTLNCDKKIDLIKVYDRNRAYLLCSVCGEKVDEVADDKICDITKICHHSHNAVTEKSINEATYEERLEALKLIIEVFDRKPRTELENYFGKDIIHNWIEEKIIWEVDPNIYSLTNNSEVEKMQVDETPEKLDFNDDFKKAFNLIENTKRNLFITGKAGTGKSTLLKYFTANTKKNVVVVAPTGLAAVNVEGQTLHSFFKFPPTLITKDDIKKNRGNVYRWIDTLIIDEISNVRVDILDAADKVMRQNGRNKNEPFGGAQIVFFGDLYQLPPVVDRAASPFIEDSYGTPYFFSLNVIKELDLKIVELAKIYRQKDQEFIHILDKIRTGKLSEEDLNKLNERVTEEVSSDEYVNLVPTNYLAKIINCKKLDALSGSIYTYKAKLEGEFKPTTNNLPAELELQLKEGARVIFVKNHPHEFWVNGTMGRVISLGPDWVKVKLDGTEEVVQVTSATWEKYKYAYDCESKELIKEKIGKFKQIPLRLAWAMTIHKSQGQTFNKLVLDTSPGIWESGQLYVALSRCRTLEGLFLKTPIWMNDIKIDSRVTEFLNNYKEVDK